MLVLLGKDAPRFVQGLVSADVGSLGQEFAVPASLLTVKAKLLSDAVVWREAEDRFILAVPASRGQAMLEHVDRHIIMDDVTVQLDVSRTLALHCAAGDDLPESDEERLVRRCRFPLPGQLWVGSTSGLEAIGANVQPGGAEDFDEMRVISGLPAWGRELDERRLPPEAGFTASISYKKGCFMGQEPLARIHARGQVNRVLVRVSAAGLESGDLPVTLRDEATGKEGELCTWAPGPGIGLAIVHRSLATPGLRLNSPFGELEVQTHAIGDDPGMKATR